MSSRFLLLSRTLGAHEPRRTLLVLALLGALWACDKPASAVDPKVPFKLGTGEAKKAQDDAPSSPAIQEGLEPQSATYAPPIDQPVLDGQVLALTVVRATLLADLDNDGDRDALALLDNAEQKLELHVALREAHGFAEARRVSSFAVPLAEGCAVEQARIEALSATKAVATVTSSCGEPAVPGPTSYVFLALERAPRVYERLELPTRADGSMPLALAFESADRDDDRHDDVVLAFTLLASEGGEPRASEALKVTLFDRPNGLVRDAREPETTLSAWASAALALAARSPDEAAVRAREVLAMRRALCREAEKPLLRSGDAPGFVCGRGKSSHDAALALVLAEAKKKRVEEAFSAYRALLRADPKPDEKALERAHAALRTLPAEPGVTLRQGPLVELSNAPSVTLPRARFIDENTLFVRRASPVLVAFESAAELPAQEPADDLVRDPSGQLAVTAIERSCAGYVLRIERRPAPTPSYLRAPPVSTPLLMPLQSPPGCTVLPEAARRDDGGFRVLGWAPQGVVVVRGAERVLVPLDLEGKPAGDPRSLERGTPAPAPLPLGAALVDGSLHAEATPFGVLVYHAQGVSLLRPEGYDSAATNPTEVAVSPSGKRVAVVSGGRVLLLQRGAAP